MTPAQLRAFVRQIEKAAGKDGCWLWTGAKNPSGYGVCQAGLMVYRVAYELMVGPIPVGAELDHRCRVPACVNPHHLEPVTHKENMRRSKSRQVLPPIDYCRRGHQMTGENVRMWSNGKGHRPQCYACHLRRVAARRAGSVAVSMEAN